MARSAAPDIPRGELTELLQAWRGGDREAEERVWTLVYNQLRNLARQVRYGDGRAGTGTTTLVHEAYLRLFGAADIDWADRGHFFAVAARAMRFLLADKARRQLAKKRDAEFAGDGSVDIADPEARPPEEILAVHQALERLAEINPRQEKLVELHYFSGLTVEESAEILEVSRSTAKRDWKAVRLWLHDKLKPSSAESPPAL